MSVLIYAESAKGKFKKSAFELASYARKIANELKTNVISVSFGVDNTNELSNYGVEKSYKITANEFDKFNAKSYSLAIDEVAKLSNASLVVLSSSTDSQYIAPLLSVYLKAGYASNVVALPVSTTPFRVKRNAFSNKAYAISEITTENKVVSIIKNSFGLMEDKKDMNEEEFIPKCTINNGVILEKVEASSGKVTIADAEIVVSAGRGLKGPENWGMIEELASVLGAATACSKPVSDIGWRPHSEHVGQTGKPVSSNLYIAIGISGAIQHIAGINSSKTKVVINNDPEAPFFKVADYGIVGDAFEVVPKLIEKLKIFKQ